MQKQYEYSIEDEFTGADFGDKRLNQRLKAIAFNLGQHPSHSFPEACGSLPELAATYRFLGNARVTPEKILAPHIEATVRRACEFKGEVLVAHDTTTISFSGDVRTELGWITGARGGFLAHC